MAGMRDFLENPNFSDSLQRFQEIVTQLTWKWLLRPLLTTSRTPSICMGKTSEQRTTYSIDANATTYKHPATNKLAFYAETFTQQLSVTNITTQTFPIYLYTSGGTHRTSPGLAGRSLSPAAGRMQRQMETRQRTPAASQSRAAPSAPGQQHRQVPVAEGWVNWQLVHCPF